MAESQKRIQNEAHVAPYDGSGAIETAYKKKMMRSVVFIDTKSVIHSRDAVYSKIHALCLYQKGCCIVHFEHARVVCIGVVCTRVVCIGVVYIGVVYIIGVMYVGVVYI